MADTLDAEDVAVVTEGEFDGAKNVHVAQCSFVIEFDGKLFSLARLSCLEINSHAELESESVSIDRLLKAT